MWSEDMKITSTPTWLWLINNSLYGDYHGNHDLNYWKNDLIDNKKSEVKKSKYMNWSI